MSRNLKKEGKYKLGERERKREREIESACVCVWVRVRFSFTGLDGRSVSVKKVIRKFRAKKLK